MEVNQVVLLGMIGLLAGFLSGTAGIGGGLIMVPAMVYLLGMTQHNAQGTSLALLMMPVGVLAVVQYYNKGFVNVKYALILALFFVAGAYMGSRLAVNMPEKTLKTVFGVCMLLVGVKMIFGK
jgi:hypothetical protein